MTDRLLGAIVLFLVFCSTLGCKSAIDRRTELKNCDFALKGARIENVGLDSFTLKVDLKIYNPNAIDVVLDKMDVDVLVGDDALGRLTHGMKTTIESGTKKIVHIRANIRTVTAYKTIKKLLNDENLSYRFKGTVYFETIFGDISFPFETKEGDTGD